MKTAGNLPVHINDSQCRKTARVLSEITIRSEFYRREFLTTSSDREARLRMYFFSVAICHQTHQLCSKEFNLYGWDYFEHVYLRVIHKYTAFINPGYLAAIGEKQTAEYLAWLFGPDKHPELCSLDNLDLRAALLVDSARLLREKYSGSVSALLDSCHGKLFDEKKGIYHCLEEFRAYSDPHRKKSSFFLKLAIDAGLLHIHDPENMLPIMDYHMQRVLLRMGCVEISDNDFRQKLIGRIPLSTDEPIRTACINAVALLSQYSGYPVWKMNDVLWALGRSCCNETVLCQDGRCAKEPCTLLQIADIATHNGNCVFESGCMGSTDPEYRNLWHPVIETDYY